MMNIIHNLFFFLSSLEGILLKYFIVFFLTCVVTYTIFSEYARTKEPEMKFLAVGFAFLSTAKGIVAGYLGIHVFGNIPLVITQSRLPLFDNVLEILALIMVANAFLYPHYSKNRKLFRRKIRYEFFVSLLAITAVTAKWVHILASMNAPVNFYLFKGNLLFLLLKLYFLLMPVVFMTLIVKKQFRFKRDIMFAFGMYAIAPLVELINYGLMGGSQHQLYGIVIPFPLLATLLWARIVYHKLANKVSLHAQLKESEKKYQQAKEVSKLKDEIVSVVSHELKTPLTSIKLYLSLMQEGEFGKNTKEQDDALTILNEETDRLENLVNDVLDLAKLEAKKSSLVLEEVDVAEFLEDHPHYILAQEKGLQVEKVLPEKCVVHTDLAKLQQITVNLLSNAVRHTPKGGSLTITVSQKAEMWTLAIADTGEGIAKEKQKHLFKKFYQAADHMTRSHGGTGLGLAIVSELVALMQGEISVKSAKGKGTTFTIHLPKKPSIERIEAN